MGTTAREALDALINLGIVYIVLSVAASSILELLSQIFRVRGRVLGNAISGLLAEATTDFYALPTINGFRQIGYWRATLSKKSTTPQAVTARTVDNAVDFLDCTTFAQAIGTLDANDKLPAHLKGKNAPFRYQGALQLDQVRLWFDQAMRAARRQYRRTAQLGLFMLGLMMAIAVHIDSIDILLGAFDPNATAPAGAMKLAGYMMTAAAVSLGAQYWFDMIGRLLGLRAQAESSGVWGRAAKRP